MTTSKPTESAQKTLNQKLLSYAGLGRQSWVGL
jgi:hypothetical protein